MSTFLQLCQTLRAESDIPGDGTPADVANQVGDLADVVRWIQQAHLDIQNSNGGLWRWLHRTFTLTTVIGDGVYAFGDCVDITGPATAANPPAGPIDRFNRWDLEKYRGPDCPKITLASVGQAGDRELIWLPFDQFRRQFYFGAQANNAPTYVSVDEQDNIVLGPVPDAVYTVTGRYFRGPQVMVANGEIPEMPPQFHDLIWVRALEKYAYKNVSTEMLARVRAEDRRLFTQLMSRQLPQITIGLPAA